MQARYNQKKSPVCITFTKESLPCSADATSNHGPPTVSYEACSLVGIRANLPYTPRTRTSPHQHHRRSCTRRQSPAKPGQGRKTLLMQVRKRVGKKARIGISRKELVGGKLTYGLFSHHMSERHGTRDLPTRLAFLFVGKQRLFSNTCLPMVKGSGLTYSQRP